MKKIKSPWYAFTWIIIWTVALLWFLKSGMFDEKESAGLIVVWIVMVGSTLYTLWKYYRLKENRLKMLQDGKKDAH